MSDNIDSAERMHREQEQTKRAEIQREETVVSAKIRRRTLLGKCLIWALASVGIAACLSPLFHACGASCEVLEKRKQKSEIERLEREHTAREAWASCIENVGIEKCNMVHTHLATGEKYEREAR